MKSYKVRFYLSYAQEIMANDKQHAKEIVQNYYKNSHILNIYPMEKQKCLNCDTGFTNIRNKKSMKFCSDKCRHAHYYKTIRKFNREQNKEVIREYDRKYYHTVRKLKREELRKCN